MRAAARSMRDGDGVIDCNDRCPNTPKGCKVDASGCPVDSDGDGVCDGIDKCPDTPKGCKVDATGCPMDSDGDGVCDGLDKCPDTPRGTKVDATGCPIAEEAPLFEGRRSLVLEGVNFASDKWELTDEAKAILNPVATSLKDWPGVRIEVDGHTDSTDTDQLQHDTLPEAGRIGHELPGRAGSPGKPADGEGLRREPADRRQQDQGRAREEPPRGDSKME